MSARKRQELNMSTEQSGFIEDIEHFKKNQKNSY